MRAEELEKLVRFKDDLNPDIWQNNNLRREVEYKLLLIAKEFVNFINIPDLKLKDITLSGSNASYNYNDHSDLDLHLIVDMDTPCGAQLKELFQAKKSQFNDQYDILIRGHEVEVYVQDAKQPHISNGIYSVLKDEWLKQPKKISANPDETNIKHKYEFLKAEIDRAVESMDPRAIARLQLKIKDMRKAGLEKSGEYGVENLAFKLLRNDGSLDALYSAKQKADDMKLSLPENFADGKNPGRKGLAKRMGVPTGASVTRLRQIAKNSSGEKARMAHWMANMKSGKQKANEESLDLPETVQLTELDAWHGSFRPRIGKFKPFSHFGNEQAARDRLAWMAANDPRFQGQPTGYLYKLDLGINNPVRVKDYPALQDIGTGSLAKLAAWALDIAKDPRTKSYTEKVKVVQQGKYVYVTKTGSELLKGLSNYIKSGYWQEYDTQKSIIDRFVSLCRKSGIDGLVYKNQVESAGKDSYIAFSPDSVRVIGRAKPVDLTSHAKKAKALGTKAKIKS